MTRWLATTYVAGEIAIPVLAMAVSPNPDDAGSPFAGLLLMIWIIAAATHTALLDNDKSSIGK